MQVQAREKFGTREYSRPSTETYIPALLYPRNMLFSAIIYSQKI